MLCDLRFKCAVTTLINLIKITVNPSNQPNNHNYLSATGALYPVAIWPSICKRRSARGWSSSGKGELVQKGGNCHEFVIKLGR
jgi:hypothetical protein